ncbi:Inherit from COG: Hemolysin-type calcium-binding [Seminavis robusta]|uniref:Inherit from COG: Hemolysin-type calcium-binding n=1 Tax=Seminavis robusta TaxID=568900 RepID=A0A9N8DV28_9STRA|nr:Inherit from COG: Hemolysin-type calcium-binding [Seminavis robusta]|eukprot:Sro373_g129080.1 Inherit from COG: Hemolysin-type calcium-binding (611) ;mRNA; r:54744-56576
MLTTRRLVLPATVLVALILISGLILVNVWVAERHVSSVVSFRIEGFQRVEPAKKTTSSVSTNQFYVTNAICGGCYHAIAIPEKNIRCGLLIHNLMEQKSLSLETAAETIATEHQDACVKCHPSSCTPTEKLYWRYDASQQIPHIVSSHLFPSLLPSKSRVPTTALSNLTAFFSAANSQPEPPRFLFHYNPSIVLLPPDNNHALLADHDNDPPVYVASFRVSTQQSCFYPHESKELYGGTWNRKPPTQDFLALAVLRSDLSIVHTVVVNVKTSGVFPAAEDFRLFVFGNQLYVASFDFIAPMDIWLEGDDDHHQMKEGFAILDKVFPSRLTVAIRQFPSCPVCYHRPNLKCGAKNLNYFATSTPENKSWVELWPGGPHIVQQMMLDEPCSQSRQQQQATEEESHPTYSDAEVPTQPAVAWHTMEEVMFPNMEPSEVLLARGRGGACCVSLTDPHGNSLLVGIFHTKIPKFGKRSGKRLPLWNDRGHNNATAAKVLPNQYLSRWYAFSPSPPFAVVAQSGWFCLGFPSVTQEADEPLIQATRWKTMVFGDDRHNGQLVLNCPRIHFVSGITEKHNDPSTILVAYGINDCFSRIVEMKKEDISKVLFGKMGVS